MAYEGNVTILRCDYGRNDCSEAFVPPINKGRRELRIMAIEAGWSCVKRGQWTDLCPTHANQFANQPKAIEVDPSKIAPPPVPS